MAETKPALEVLRELRASLCNPNLICRGCGQQYLRCACVIVLDDAEADEKAGAALQQAVAADQPVAKALALALLAAGQQPFAGAAAATQEPEAVPATAAMQQQQQVQGTGSQESEVTHTAAEEDLQLDFADDAGGFEGHTADQGASADEADTPMQPTDGLVELAAAAADAQALEGGAAQPPKRSTKRQQAACNGGKAKRQKTGEVAALHAEGTPAAGGEAEGREAQEEDRYQEDEEDSDWECLKKLSSSAGGGSASASSSKASSWGEASDSESNPETWTTTRKKRSMPARVQPRRNAARSTARTSAAAAAAAPPVVRPRRTKQTAPAAVHAAAATPPAPAANAEQAACNTASQQSSGEQMPQPERTRLTARKASTGRAPKAAVVRVQAQRKAAALPKAAPARKKKPAAAAGNPAAAAGNPAAAAGKKKTKAGKAVIMYEDGTGLVETLLPAEELRKAADALVHAEPKKEMRHEPGKEPYRSFGIRVNEEPLLSPAQCRAVQNCEKQYWDLHTKAKVTEARVAGHDKALTGKAKSQRPDLAARRELERAGGFVCSRKTAGHVPGHQPGARYFLRAILAATGLHTPPIAGIFFATRNNLPDRCPRFAVSIVNSGSYEDDKDTGDVVIFTGQGGNDLLGNKKQIAEQEQKAGNDALVGNITLGIPVRMLRKNKDEDAHCGTLFTNDGLYDVVEYWKEPGVAGHQVFRYKLLRRAGQAELTSKTLAFGGSQAPRNHNAAKHATTVNVISKDISGGLEKRPVVAVNEVDDQNPFTVLSATSAKQRAEARRSLGVIGECHPLTTYAIACKLGPNTPAPKQAVLPAKYAGRPHDYLKELNGGKLPYNMNRKTGLMVLTQSSAMVYECGPWCACPDGVDCPQALTQQGLRWRLEVFKTAGRGWGVRSWDTIPKGAFVTSFVGRVYLAGEVIGSGHDDTYLYDLHKRSDHTWDNRYLGEDALDPDHGDVEYIVDGGEVGNVSRYINHHCEPNLWVQPVLALHGERKMPSTCFFALKNIPPWTELTYDYGQQYLEQNLCGDCRCNAATCRRKPDA